MTVVFLCVANSARSQIAEGLARARFGDRIRVASAGSRPTRVSSWATAIMREVDVDLATHRSKLVDDLDPTDVELVVTLCAEEVCPVFPRPVRRLHWPLPDPAPGDGREAELHQVMGRTFAAGDVGVRFRTTRRNIAARLDGIEPMLATPPGTSIAPAAVDDRAELEALLAACKLPLDGLDDAFPHGFAVARIGGELVGAAGLEQWADRGLLRSVAVAPAHRKQHIAEALIADRLAWAKSRLRDDAAGVMPFASVSLLTTDAEAYFARLGFARGELPAAIGSAQRTACASAVAMIHRFYVTSDEALAEAIATELGAHGTLVPPWAKYPEIPRGSIGWRMGMGEWYLDMFRRWWRDLDRSARDAYRARWPAVWPDWLSEP